MQAGTRGLQGIQGEKGDPGNDYTPMIGNVETLDPALPATVSTNIDEEQNVVYFNFGIPQGIKGDTGDTNLVSFEIENGILKAYDEQGNIYNLGIVAIEPRGEYSATTSYEKLNTVLYNDSTYMALKSSLGNPPTDTEYWQLIGGGVTKEYLDEEVDEKLEDFTMVFDTVALMTASTYLKNGMVVKTLGYYSANDGGGATYKIIEGTADNLFSHALTNGNIAELVNKEEFNVLQVGAKRNENFDNAPIFSQLFKSGLNNTTIYVPEGIYQTTKINYTGDNAETTNFKFIGVGNPTIKMIHPDITKTVVGTYNDDYYVTNNIDILNFGNNCTISTIQLEDNKIFYYLKLSDNTLIPSSLVAGLVLKGTTSGVKAVISDIDTSDPDGTGTARIYLYETYNSKTKNVIFNNSSNVLNENLYVCEDLSDDYLYIRFDDNTIPSYITVNSQLEQTSSGKTARIDKITTVYNGINYIKVNCMPEFNIFSSNSNYLDDSVQFNINTYTNYTSGMLSFNKYRNSEIRGITFDGNNLMVSKYESNANNWNTIITGGCKNIIIDNCNFVNSIMAGIQIGGISNAYAPASHDYPEEVVVTNCYFRNNGRGDIEIIVGHNINISNCKGDGVLDIEANGNETLNNINVNGVEFNSITPYSPGSSSANCMINISNSKFFTFIAQGRLVVNLSNVLIHQLQPQLATIKGNNCFINMINGLHGNEYLAFTNTSFYSLYQNNPGSQFGKTKLHLNNCIIDLSLSASSGQRLYNIADFKLSNSTMVSQTTLKTIADNKTIYNCYNSTFKNIKINGVGSNIATTGSMFDSCKFLAIDNTVATSEGILSGAIIGGIVKDCYIETNLSFSYTHFSFINCILNHTTKPKLMSFKNIYASGIKADDNSGISWYWIQTGTSGNLVYFDDIQFSTSVPGNLGITNGSTAVTTSSVADGCRGYYVGSTDKALVRIYHNDTALGIKEISFS